MTVLEVRRKSHYVAWPHVLDRTAVALNQSKPGCDDQGLPERMRVPIGTGPGLEGDVTSSDPRRIDVLKQRSTRTDPVSQSGEPLADGREPFRLISRSMSLLS